MTLQITKEQKRTFRAQGHRLKPAVLVGKEDLSDAVLQAIDEALTQHELVKVKLLQSCSVEKNEAAERMSSHCKAALVQRIGRTALLYRPRPEEPEESGTAPKKRKARPIKKKSR